MNTSSTSYSDYMRCLAAKYNNNQQSVPQLPGLPGPAFKHDLLPLLAAHQSPAFPFPVPGLSLLHPFLSPGVKKHEPDTETETQEHTVKQESEKDDPLDLTEKKLTQNIEVETKEIQKAKSPASQTFYKTQRNKNCLEWTVEEVEQFVESIDECKEYSKVMSY